MYSFSIGDVVTLNNMYGESIHRTHMTVCGYDGEGRVECVWFTRNHHLKRGMFWDHNIILAGIKVDVPYDVLSAVQRWKNSTLTP